MSEVLDNLVNVLDNMGPTSIPHNKPQKSYNPPARVNKVASIPENGKYHHYTDCFRAIHKALSEIKSHRFAFPFLRPVNYVELRIPDYPSLVKRPMDIGSILAVLTKYLDNPTLCGEFPTISHLLREVHLIWDNCFLYNKSDSELYPWAINLEKLFSDKLRKTNLFTEEDLTEAGESKPNDVYEAGIEGGGGAYRLQYKIHRDAAARQAHQQREQAREDHWNSGERVEKPVKRPRNSYADDGGEGDEDDELKARKRGGRGPGKKKKKEDDDSDNDEEAYTGAKKRGKSAKRSPPTSKAPPAAVAGSKTRGGAAVANNSNKGVGGAGAGSPQTGGQGSGARGGAGGGGGGAKAKAAAGPEDFNSDATIIKYLKVQKGDAEPMSDADKSHILDLIGNITPDMQTPFEKFVQKVSAVGQKNEGEEVELDFDDFAPDEQHRVQRFIYAMYKAKGLSTDVVPTS